MIRTVVSFLAIAACCTAFASPARAQTKTIAAQTLFDEGKKLLKANQISEACRAFENSFKLEDRTTTLLNMASCHEQEGYLATAWGGFLIAVERARNEKNKQHERTASQNATRIKPVLSKLTLEVSAKARLPDLLITRDTIKAEPVTWNYAIPIDGGTHIIRVSAPGRVPWEGRVTIAKQRDAKTVVIPVLAEEPKPTPPPPVPASLPAVVTYPDGKTKKSCELAEKTFHTIRTMPPAQYKTGVRLVQLSLSNPCFASHLVELTSHGIKMACALAQYDKATLFFRHAGSHPDLVAHCPAHLAGLKKRDAKK